MLEKILAIGVVILVIAIFFVTYLLNKKTPVPEGCENLQINDENCLSCGNDSCHIKAKLDLKKISEEIKEEE